VSRLSTVPGLADPVGEQLRRLCGVAVNTVPAAGAGLSVAAKDSQLGLLVAADPVSERLEELQVVLGEGPCVEATTGRRPVLVADLGQEGPHRWPVYAAAVHEAGFRAIFAFPLQVGAAQLGVLDLFRTQPGHMSGAELRRAFALADEAVMILLDGQERGTSSDTAEPFDETLAAPPELFQAQGMVMVQIGGTLGEAMARIRAHAYAENRRLIDVARDVVTCKLRFDRDEQGAI
jgi:hypothetical protein